MARRTITARTAATCNLPLCRVRNGEEPRDLAADFLTLVTLPWARLLSRKSGRSSSRLFFLFFPFRFDIRTSEGRHQLLDHCQVFGRHWGDVVVGVKPVG